MIAWYHLPRITRLAEHEGKPDWAIVARLLEELGRSPSVGAITAWLYEQHRRAGLEPRSIPARKPTREELEAWQAIEDEWPGNWRRNRAHDDEEPIGS